MTHLREKYWILKSRKTIRKVLNRCIRCRRFTSKKSEAPIAPLPEDRVKECAVFEVTGVDLAGPLFLKDGSKAWIVLFTCGVYRAVHLELVTSMSTDTFLQALRRFIARRGRPCILYSDNGTNFKGSNAALKKINWKTIVSESNVQNITWKFIPPSAPWWGGWWERMVSLVKSILRKVLGRASLRYEELNTILCDCESVVNSRPITYVSEDGNDLIPLTPSMFLQEIRGNSVPDLDKLDSTYLRKRYLYRQRLREDLRKRFRIEYLGQLRQSAQKIRKVHNIKVGDIVLIGSDNTKRLEWPLAKVTEVYPGKDGVLRVARLLTAYGELLRPVQRLYPLEVHDQQGDQLRSKIKLPLDTTAHENEVLDNDSIPSAELTVKVPPERTTRSGRVVKVPKRLDI